MDQEIIESLRYLSEQELVDLIIHHKKLYYAGETEILDSTYDTIEEVLKFVNPDNPILQQVGALRE